MKEDDVVSWLCDQASALLQNPSDMGTIEKAVDRVSLQCRRRALQCLVQQQAARQDLNCPRCGAALLVQANHRLRHVHACFGSIQFTRAYGFCPGCGDYFYPADAALGLQARAPASPRVQELCALTALRAPAGQAQEDVRRLTGIDLDPSTLHREARRQGQRALARRDRDEQMTQTPSGIAPLASRALRMPSKFTLVIEIDAWNIRERDNWGKTQALRKAGQDTGRWHWVYTATIFRLEQRHRPFQECSSASRSPSCQAAPLGSGSSNPRGGHRCGKAMGRALPPLAGAASQWVTRCDPEPGAAAHDPPQDHPRAAPSHRPRNRLFPRAQEPDGLQKRQGPGPAGRFWRDRINLLPIPTPLQAHGPVLEPVW